MAGGVSGPGVVAESSYIPSQPNEIAKNGEKTGGFAHALAYKSPKTLFFALKYLTRYTHETFFEQYTNFEGYYLSRCRVKPLQSFGSHIRPQPHGLGLIRTDRESKLENNAQRHSPRPIPNDWRHFRPTLVFRWTLPLNRLSVVTLNRP